MSEEFIMVPGDENELSDIIREAIGAGKYDEVRVRFPQFERPDGSNVYYYPKTIDEFDKLQELPDELLYDFGLRRWSEDAGITHWLYPGEWFKYIPEGYKVVGISGEEEVFCKETSDDDIRYGCLPYGFKRKANT